MFLTAKTSLLDKIVGLKLGGDDYLTKPFEAEELVARVEALLRRTPANSGRSVHEIGSLRIDVPRQEVTREGKPVYLTDREFHSVVLFDRSRWANGLQRGTSSRCVGVRR